MPCATMWQQRQSSIWMKPASGLAARRNGCTSPRPSWLTFYRVSAKRGSLLAKVTGIVVHDHWKPYYTMTGVLHALCNAHHLRELKALVEIEKEDWACKMQRLLRRACHATNLARERGVPLKPGLIALIERCYDAILANGLAFHEAQPALAKAGAAAVHRDGLATTCCYA